jgi:hypothetical protein
VIDGQATATPATSRPLLTSSLFEWKEEIAREASHPAFHGCTRIC